MVPMVGALPAVARLTPQITPPVPCEATIALNNWLAPAGTSLRGYLNGRWTLEPSGPLVSYVGSAGQELDLVGQYQVIGSRLHLNFAAQSQLLKGFFRPTAAAFAHSATI
jgi:hypothetical protein